MMQALAAPCARRLLHGAAVAVWQQLHLSVLPQLPTSQQLWQQAQQQAPRLQQRYSVPAAAGQGLDDILKLQLLQDKSPQEVSAIWMAHHEASQQQHVASVMSAAEADLLAARAAASPLMVLPLAKPPGKAYVTLLVQWQQGGSSALVTTLEEFRAGAPTPHLRLVVFTELAKSHGLALVRGSLHSPRLISAPEARTVAELLRALYTDDEDGHRLVHLFNHHPDRFDFNELLKQLGLA